MEKNRMATKKLKKILIGIGILMSILIIFQNPVQSETGPNDVVSQSKLSSRDSKKAKVSRDHHSEKSVAKSLKKIKSRTKKTEVPKPNEKEIEHEKNGDDVPQVKLHF